MTLVSVDYEIQPDILELSNACSDVNNSMWCRLMDDTSMRWMNIGFDRVQMVFRAEYEYAEKS